MAWELHKKKGKELYNIWSTIMDDYLYDFDTKAHTEQRVLDRFIEDAKDDVDDFMNEVFEEID